MQVAVDTNILVADPWFEGQKLTALIDFVDRTRSEIVIHAVVAEELRAVLERQWRATFTELESATRKVKRLGVQVPELDVEKTVAALRARLEATHKRIAYHTHEISLDGDLLQEALRRSARRVPPCARTGEEIRDALLWLGLMRYCERSGHQEIAFISNNTRDFCGTEAGTLAPELELDALVSNTTVHFYSTLDDFLRDHAKPIEHLTTEWVLERIEMTEVEAMIGRYMRLRDASEYRTSWRYNDWSPAGYPRVTDVNADLTDVYVWEYAADQPASLFLNFSASIEAELTAEKEEGDPEWGYYTETREISATAERNVEISATVQGDTVELIGVEHVEKA